MKRSGHMAIFSFASSLLAKLSYRGLKRCLIFTTGFLKVAFNPCVCYESAYIKGISTPRASLLHMCSCISLHLGLHVHIFLKKVIILQLQELCGCLFWLVFSNMQ